MKNPVLILGLALAGLPLTRAEEWLDRVGEALTFTARQGHLRARVSGSLELEHHYRSEPVADLRFTDRPSLFSPRLILFLDAQWGPRVYGFAQARVDHGFDPTSDGSTGLRLDEWAVRLTPGAEARWNVQVGQFATVVGNWARRHAAWNDAFITPPLPYDNLTGVWDQPAVPSAATLLSWAHVRPVSSGAAVAADQRLRLPIVWGPSYATGAVTSGRWGRFEYAVEVKNAALSSRPESWSGGREQWRHPTISSRLGWRPNPAWDVGLSASGGTYLRPDARRSLRGAGFSDYRQLTVAQDVSFAWHHWQVWAEVFASRFEIPRVGDADTLAYYVEARYRVTPRLAAAVRWNQHLFDRLPDGRGGQVAWGRQVWRVDLAPAWRLTPHVQVKVQLSLRHEEPAVKRLTQALSSQVTVRF